MPIEWRKEFSIDSAQIDSDHQQLIALLNDFELGKTVSQLKNVLGELLKYARGHFSREEELQVLVAFPFHAAHARAHKELIQELKDVIADFNKAKDVRSLLEVRAETATLLRHWLVDHIIKADLLMRPYADKLRNANAGKLRLAHAGK